MPKPADVRAALQRVAAACDGLLAGAPLPPDAVSESDLLEAEMALRAGGLLADRLGSEAVKIALVRDLIDQKLAFATEYRLPARADKARARWFRADLVVLRDFTPTVAVECKGYDRQIGGTRQRQNYARCGTPAIHVGPHTVSQAVAAIVAFISGATPLPDELLVSDVFVVGGKGAHVQEGTEVSDNGSTAQSQRSKSPTERSEVSTTRTTWLTPYIDAYRLAYRDKPTEVAIRRMARAFKRMEIDSPRAEVVRRFANYLHATPARFYSVEHFADTFPAWDTANGDMWKRDQTLQRPGETLDQYATRLSYL